MTLPNTSITLYDLDLMHPSCCDTMGIYRNEQKADGQTDSLVNICRTILAIRDFCNLFCLCVTLNFDVLIPKVDYFMPLPSRPLVPTCIQIGSFVFKISCSQVC